MKQIKIIILVVSTILFFTACNDETNIYQDTPTESTIDNSKLADDENQYGYFGRYVEFGDGVVLTSLSWRIDNTSNGDLRTIEFLDDGYATYHDWSTEGEYDGDFDYGVSQDGTVIKTSDGGEIEYIKSFTRDIGMDANGNRIYDACYLLSYPQRFGNDKVEACVTCFGEDYCEL